jgi:Tol biopolymer transport system component
VARFYSADEISYVIPRFGPTAKLVRTNLTTQVTETFVSGGVGLWDWSRDGKTLAYFDGYELWLKHQGQGAVSLASYKMQGGRGGGWIDQLAIRFSPSGQYFVFVHTVTTPLTFEIRRASDGAVVWSAPKAELQSPNWATKAVWSRTGDRLYFRQGPDVRTWEPAGTVTTLVAGLKWITTSMSPDGNSIAYAVEEDKSPYTIRVALLNLQTLQSTMLIADRVGAKFASDRLLLYTKAVGGPGGSGVVAYDIKTGVETVLPYDQVIDVWPAGL